LVLQRVVHEFIFKPGSGGYILTLTYALLHGLCARFGLGLSAATDPAVLAMDADEAARHTALSFHRLDREYRGLHSPQRGPLLEEIGRASCRERETIMRCARSVEKQR